RDWSSDVCSSDLTRLGDRDRFQRDVAVMQRGKERRCLTWMRERAGDLAGFEMYLACGDNSPKFVHRDLRVRRLGEFQAKPVSAHSGFEFPRRSHRDEAPVIED